jgi:DNA helicase-2/ATP-dependent DNA helicase PcrA
MEFAADLHLHSRYAGGVSKAMTLPAIAAWAQRKGMDLLGTGDCLQESWLKEIELALEPAEPGLFRLRPETQVQVDRTVPPALRRPLRFVLSTEVHCAPAGTPPLGGIHHLIYFPSLDSVRRLRSRLEPIGDLTDGRPMLGIDSYQLLQAVVEQNDGLKLAPAHVLNPWYASLGTISGARSLETLFRDLTPQLCAVEMGLTSTPAMCGRLSTLDRHALFCCSDAHSLANIGREYLVVDIEPSFDHLFAAIQSSQSPHRRGMVKYPVARARYYPNWCGHCQRGDFAQKCPECGKPLVAGSRDRLEAVADRRLPDQRAEAAHCQQLRPLELLLADLGQCSPKSKAVSRDYDRLVSAVGNERYILTRASAEQLALESTPQIARQIVEQRTATPGSKPVAAPLVPANRELGGDQLSLRL